MKSSAHFFLLKLLFFFICVSELLSPLLMLKNLRTWKFCKTLAHPQHLQSWKRVLLPQNWVLSTGRINKILRGDSLLGYFLARKASQGKLHQRHLTFAALFLTHIDACGKRSWVEWRFSEPISKVRRIKHQRMTQNNLFSLLKWIDLVI